jgi:hypothetical protein
MTRNLALLIGRQQTWLGATQFLDKLDHNLKQTMG